MKYDILNIADIRKGEKSFLVAMPAIAYECEVHPPLENELDAYEEAVLKFVSVGLSAGGIAQALNASESLIDGVLANLECKEMVKKTAGNPWVLDAQGAEYLKGNTREQPSANSKYGYVFVNPIKKDVMPFFYYGDLGRAPLLDAQFQNDGKPVLEILRLEDDQDLTFDGIRRPRAYDVEKAYLGFVKCEEILERRANNEITVEEAKSEIAALEVFEAQFDDLDSLDEEEIESAPTMETDADQEKKTKESSQGRKLVRLLQNHDPQRVYLTARVMIDPSTAEGFKISSPFNMRGVDDAYYIRQMLWLMAQDDVFIGKERLSHFMDNEILKLCKTFKTSKMDFKQRAKKDMPHLVVRERQFPWLYEKLAGEYGAMQRNPDLREKKNIVRNFGSDVVEPLLDLFFKNNDPRELRNISRRAQDDVRTLKGSEFLKEMLSKTFLSDRDVESWNANILEKPIKNMESSHGNGAWEKLVNILVLNYYRPTPFTKQLLEADNAGEVIRRIGSLNKIRNLVTHTKSGENARTFEDKDYNEYVDNVFPFVDSIIAAFERN